MISLPNSIVSYCKYILRTDIHAATARHAIAAGDLHWALFIQHQARSNAVPGKHENNPYSGYISADRWPQR